MGDQAIPVLERRAADVMTSGVVTLPVTASLADAARAMAAHRVHGVLVVSTDGRPCGWVTAQAVTPHVGDDHLLDWAVDAIGEPFVAVRPRTPLREVAALLAAPDLSRVAVQGREGVLPHGVITELDVASLMGT